MMVLASDTAVESRAFQEAAQRGGRRPIVTALLARTKTVQVSARSQEVFHDPDSELR